MAFLTFPHVTITFFSINFTPKCKSCKFFKQWKQIVAKNMFAFVNVTECVEGITFYLKEGPIYIYQMGMLLDTLLKYAVS